MVVMAEHYRQPEKNTLNRDLHHLSEENMHV